MIQTLKEMRDLKTLRAVLGRHGREVGGDAIDQAECALAALGRLEGSLAYWKKWADGVHLGAEGVLLAGGLNLVEWRERALKAEAEVAEERSVCDALAETNDRLVGQLGAMEEGVRRALLHAQHPERKAMGRINAMCAALKGAIAAHTALSCHGANPGETQAAAGKVGK